MGYYESLYLCLDAEALNILTVTAYHDDVFAGMFFKKFPGWLKDNFMWYKWKGKTYYIFSQEDVDKYF